MYICSTFQAWDKVLRDSLAFFSHTLTSYIAPQNSSESSCSVFKPTLLPHDDHLKAILVRFILLDVYLNINYKQGIYILLAIVIMDR